MSIDLADYESRARESIKAFWGNRQAALQRQERSGKADQGERGSVTAGKNMDGFLDLMREIVRRNGLEAASICTERRVLTLPGHFRPTKLWDMLVMNKRRLVAAIELKSQCGPSFGNNFNNRAEEAIGTAVDLWTAFREGAFGDAPQPFVGWMMLLEDCGASRSPVSDQDPHFAVSADFRGASYADRYGILCRRLMQEHLYTAAAFMRSPRSAATTGEYSELSESTGLGCFVRTLAGHVAAEAARAR